MNKITVHIVAPITFLVFSTAISAQTKPGSVEGLFENDSVLKITLSGNLRDLMTDKADNPQNHPVTVSYMQEGKEISVNAEAKTRGHFRRTMGNCTYPPLLLQFTKNETLSSSIFKEQDKIKLVMPCVGDDYVIKEWLVYKIYNLVTSKSFRARLVSVELYDSKKKKSTSPFYGILLEEDKQMAKRNEDVLVKRQLKPEQTDPTAFLTMAVFEYLVGNTDWSVQYQNIKLVAPDSLAVPTSVPYDFDHAGLVSPPYAKPAEELNMNSVRERRYRGYCVQNMEKFDPVVALYNKLKPAIYKLYTDCTLLDPKYVKSTIKYFDEFYETINDPAKLKKEFGYPCDKNGTGNVVIKGLRGEPQE
ncbi:MAG TPA: hypothetical protein VE933_03860 [Chitinophagaceae bacterium]|nr:hypothetical protein [Chitinophagaceae bacterium]